MQKRILGLETEYGVVFTSNTKKLLPEEVSRYLFKSVLSWGRTSNIFLPNGARLYLDVGSHPEYASAECDSIKTLLAAEKAGDEILKDLAHNAQEVIKSEGNEGELHIIKNNSDMLGNSFGSHENYLMQRETSFEQTVEYLIPLLLSRILICGAGRIVGDEYHISQRSEFMWESVSSATTRSRPMINSRDEPHSDSELFRRLHIIVGDSNISQLSSFLKIGVVHLILRIIEEKPELINPDYFPNYPIFALKTFSSDLDLKKKVDCKRGKFTAIEILSMYRDAVEQFVYQFDINEEEKLVYELFSQSVEAIKNLDENFLMSIDWFKKNMFLNKVKEKYRISINSTKCRYLDVLYHNLCDTNNFFDRVPPIEIVDESEINYYKNNPPKTTRANLRSKFILAAQELKVDYTVDWIHLKLNDQSQRTCVLKDPFKFEDERVEKLIEKMKN